MKDYRVAKCIIGTGKNARIEDCVIFLDGSGRFPIHNDEQYGDYIYVNNKYNKKSSILRESFTDRIKDAYESIKSGNGDCIKGDSILGFKFMYVVRFLDRDKGENIRKKFLEGFENTEFGWTIRIRNKDSFGEGSLIDKNYISLGAFSNSKRYVFFETEEDTRAFVDKMMSEIKKIANIFIKNYEKYDDGSNFKEIVNIVEKEYPDFVGSVLYSLVFDVLDDNYKSLKKEDDVKENSENILTKNFIEIIQCIKYSPKKIEEEEYKSVGLIGSHFLYCEKEQLISALKEISLDLNVSEVSNILKKNNIDTKEKNVNYCLKLKREISKNLM